MIIMGHGAVTMLECQVEMLVSHSILRFGHSKWIARAEFFIADNLIRLTGLSRMCWELGPCMRIAFGIAETLAI